MKLASTVFKNSGVGDEFAQFSCFDRAGFNLRFLRPYPLPIRKLRFGGWCETGIAGLEMVARRRHLQQGCRTYAARP